MKYMMKILILMNLKTKAKVLTIKTVIQKKTKMNLVWIMVMTMKKIRQIRMCICFHLCRTIDLKVLRLPVSHSSLNSKLIFII